MQVIKVVEENIQKMKPVHGLLVRDWKENVVNLVQYPRTHTVVSASPFALKLETWLRMNGIKYHNVSNEFTKASSKGQIPFIELNGRSFADSNFIIEHLRSQFNISIDGHLSTIERAYSRAFQIMIEESLFRCVQYYRGKDCTWFASEQGFLPHLPGYQKFLFQKIVIKQLQSRIKKCSVIQGYGRHTPEEVDEILKKDLTAISTQLGDKPYLFGDNPTTLDATLFGHLVQVTDTPLKTASEIKPFMETNTPNLLAFVQRVKDTYWPDWNAITEHLALNPEDIKVEPPAASAAPEATQPEPVATEATQAQS